MSLRELEEVAATAKGSVADLPDEFEGEVVSTEIREDSRFNRKLLYAVINVDGTDYAVTYKPLHLKVLIKRLKKLHCDEFAGKFRFEKYDFGIGNPRPIPIEVL